MNRCWAVLIIIVLTGLFGCAPSKKAVKERNLSYHEVLSKVDERNNRITTAKAKGTITIEDPDESNVGSFMMELVKPDSLRIDLKGPFGVRVGTFTLSQNQFIFYNRMDNTVMVGDPAGERLHSFLPIRMKTHEIINALVGEVPTLNERDTLLNFSIEKEQYTFRYASPEKLTEISIDGDVFVASSYRTTDFDGNEQIGVNVSEIEYNEDIAVPYLIRIVSQAENRSVTIVYDEIIFNKPVICSFTVPPHAKVVKR